MAFDSVVSYTIVLPDGTITTASNKTNTDLFWGLKGGYNNFGESLAKVFSAQLLTCFRRHRHFRHPPSVPQYLGLRE